MTTSRHERPAAAPSDPFSLHGHTAIVTGGASGLGLGITAAIVAAGGRVAVIGSRSPDDVRDALASFGPSVAYYRHDLSDTDGIPGVVAAITSDLAPVTELVNNAGIHRRKPIEEMTVRDFEDVLDIHLVAAFALTKAVVPHMKANRRGTIIFQASMTSFIGQPHVTGYSAAKAGYLGMVHTLSAECGPFGVRVNAIAPGWIDSPMFRQATAGDPARLAKIMSRIQLSRVGTPEDVGRAAVFLCSDAARYVTGACLPVDGGALVGF